MFVCSECGASQPSAGACQACGGATASGSEDPLLGATLGPYRIARLLGVGGMGRVYKGVQPQIGSRVAVKVLSRECTDRKDLVERFFAEARAVNLIRHESIVNVLDLAMLPDGRPYIVMEYLDGAPLSDLVTRLGPMPLGGVARLAVEVLDALAAAHAKGIVHRDLKPDNIFVTPAGRAKVLDFGIAKLLPELGGSYTQTGSLLGTPHYMSPEQASGKPVDLRTDLYAMGVILFECVTGHKPFYGDSMFDLLRKHVDSPPPPPRSIRPDLPPAYEQVILMALAKDPAQRFASAHAMAAALQQSSAGMPAEQWTQISGVGAGLVSPSPSGASWGTPASWGGVARAVPEGSAPQPLPVPPMMGPAPTPGGAPLPYLQARATQPMGGGPPPYGVHPSTATAGQAVGTPRRGRGKGLLWGGLALAVGGIAVAAVALGGGGAGSGGSASGAQGSAVEGSAGAAADGATPASAGASSGSAVAAGAGSGTAGGAAGAGAAASPPPAGGAGARPGAAPPSSADSADDEPPVAPVASGAGAPGGIAELAEMQELLRSLPEEQRALVREQLRMVEDQIKALPPAQRAMVLRQLRDSLRVAKSASAASLAEAADDDTPAQPAPDAEPELTAPMPRGWDGKRFDVTAYLPTAVAAVKKIAPDAALFRIDASGVRADGLVDLSLGSVRYGFISKARATRPKNVPLGARWDPSCQLNVWVEASGVDVREFSGCKETPVPLPACSLKQRWQKAIAKGAPRDNAVAELGYRAGVINGKPVWFFDIDDVFDDGPSPDACP